MKKIIKLSIATAQALAAIFYVGLFISIGKYFVNYFINNNKEDYSYYVTIFFVGSVITQSVLFYARKKFPNELASAQIDHKKIYVLIAIIIASIFVITVSSLMILSIL
jgi:fucose permease